MTTTPTTGVMFVHAAHLLAAHWPITPYRNLRHWR
jgi:hypothetical protein